MTIYGALTLLGCKASLPANLSPGYSGEVQINCGSTRQNVKSIDVGATGRLDGARCPQSKTDLNIIRDGKEIAPIGHVIWETTGDGILVQIRFTVR